MTGATILGLSPGTRYVGIAMLHNGELHQWKIKSYKGIYDPTKVDRTLSYIESLIVLQVINSIACKVPHPKRTSAILDGIIQRIKALAEEYKIDCRIYTIDDLKSFFKMRFSNKYLLAENVARKFPQLNAMLIRERKNKHKYHIRTFEAIAAGLCYHRDCYS
jgi:hypothetical protein